MKESCKTCALKLSLENYDYSGGGCTHTAVDGYACMVFQTEGVAVWMTGIEEENGRCEMYRPKGGKYASVKG